MSRCALCGKEWAPTSERESSRVCPGCRSRIGRAKQKVIQRSARKKKEARQ